MTDAAQANATRLANDVLLTEFVAGASMNEEVGELLSDLGNLASVARQHMQRQVEIGQRYFSDLTQVRTVDQWFAAQLHVLRASVDNQLSFVTDATRLQAEAVARTRHALGVGFAAAEQAVSGRSAKPHRDAPRH